MAHAYCSTANVLRTQKIYCKDCYSYYHLYVKSERIFSSEYMYGVAKLVVTFLIISGGIYGVYELDNYLKRNFQRSEYN